MYKKIWDHSNAATMYCTIGTIVLGASTFLSFDPLPPTDYGLLLLPPVICECYIIQACTWLCLHVAPPSFWRTVTSLVVVSTLIKA